MYSLKKKKFPDPKGISLASEFHEKELEVLGRRSLSESGATSTLRMHITRMLIGFGIRAGAFDEDFKGRGMETGTSTYIYTHAHTYIRMQEAGEKTTDK